MDCMLTFCFCFIHRYLNIDLGSKLLTTVVEFSSAVAGPRKRIGRGLIVADRQPEIEAAVKISRHTLFLLTFVMFPRWV